MRYLKFFGAVVVTVIVALVGYLAKGPITNLDWVNVAIVGVGALAIFAAPNVPGAEYTKTILAVLAAVLTALHTFIASGVSLSTPQILQIVVVALGALGIHVLPSPVGVHGVGTTKGVTP